MPRTAKQIRQLEAKLTDLCQRPVPIKASRTIAVLGPKGGSGKTPTAAALITLLSNQIPGLIIGADCNPDKGTLRERMCPPDQITQQRLIHLAKISPSVTHYSQLSPFIQPAGRAQITHNDGVPPEEIKGAPTHAWAAAFDKLAMLSAGVVLDCGTNLVSNLAEAALSSADHLVIVAEAGKAQIRLACEAVNDLQRYGYEDLVRNGTVVITCKNPNVNLTELQSGFDWLRARCNRNGSSESDQVIIAPYDRYMATARNNQIDPDQLSADLRAAYLKLAVDVVTGTYTQAPLSSQRFQRLAAPAQPTARPM